ncbi:MAG: hypothetical protein HGA51_08625, partial [Demequinaceae bacterium]|nr:hypothetical protein [Demequinaceae bacterium]
GWLSNRLLGPAVVVGAAISAAALLVPPVASALGQRAPGVAGAAVALLTPLAVLAVDAGDKAVRARRSQDHSPITVAPEG